MSLEPLDVLDDVELLDVSLEPLDDEPESLVELFFGRLSVL